MDGTDRSKCEIKATDKAIAQLEEVNSDKKCEMVIKVESAKAGSNPDIRDCFYFKVWSTKKALNLVASAAVMATTIASNYL